LTLGVASGIRATSLDEGGLEPVSEPLPLDVSPTSVTVIVTVSDTEVVPSLTSTVSV
jgi:hypothetical protein